MSCEKEKGIALGVEKARKKICSSDSREHFPSQNLSTKMYIVL
jgi:hypothetical protein